MADIDLKELTTLLDEQFTRVSTFFINGMKPVIERAYNSPQINDLSRNLVGLGEAGLYGEASIRRLTTGMDGFQTILSRASTVLGSIGFGPIIKFSETLGLSGDNLLKFKDQLDQANKEFAVGQNDIIAYKTMIANSMSKDAVEFNSLLRNAGAGLMVLTGNYQTAANALSNVINQSLSDNDPKAIGPALIRSGMSIAEYNKIVALNMSSLGRTAVDSEEARMSIVNSSNELAKNLKELSIVTGKSREELLNELEKQRKTAFYEMMVAGLPEQQMKATQTAQANLIALNPALGQAALEYSAMGGIINPETIKGLGGAYSEFAAYMEAERKSKESGKTEDAAIAREAYANLAAKYSEFVTSDVARYQLGLKHMGLPNAIGGSIEGVVSYGSMATAASAKQEAEQKGISIKDVFQQRYTEAVAAATPPSIVGKETTPGQLAAETINKIGLDVAKGSATIMENINSASANFKFSSLSMVEIMNKLNLASSNVQSITDITKSSLLYLKNIYEQATKESTTPEQSTAPQISSPTVPTEKRHSGTLGMTGLNFEPEDVFVQLAKGESVLTPDQIKKTGQSVLNLANDMTSNMSESTYNLMEQVNSSIKNIKLPEIDTNIQGSLPDFSELSIDIDPITSKIQDELINVSTTINESVSNTNVSIDDSIVNKKGNDVLSGFNNITKTLTEKFNMIDFSKIFQNVDTTFGLNNAQKILDQASRNISMPDFTSVATRFKEKVDSNIKEYNAVISEEPPNIYDINKFASDAIKKIEGTETEQSLIDSLIDTLPDLDNVISPIKDIFNSVDLEKVFDLSSIFSETSIDVNEVNLKKSEIREKLDFASNDLLKSFKIDISNLEKSELVQPKIEPVKQPELPQPKIEPVVLKEATNSEFEQSQLSLLQQLITSVNTMNSNLDRYQNAIKNAALGIR